MKITTKDINFLRECLDSSFRAFVETFIPFFGTIDRYDPLFHGELCDWMQFNPSLDKLIILPRKFLKTTICTILYPLWKASRNTATRWLIVGNSMDNASKNVQAIKGIIEGNELYGVVYSDNIPDFGKARWSNACANLQRDFDHPNGTFEAAGCGTQSTGRHPTDIIEDDTVAPKIDQMTQDEMMPTRADVEKAVGFHKLTGPLLDDYEKSERIFVCTRWAQYDAVEYIKEHETDSSQIRSYAVYDIAAETSEGEPTYKCFNKAVLRSIRASMGSFMFNMLYMNNPLSKEFMKFRPEWFRYFYSDTERNFFDQKSKDKVRECEDGRKAIIVDAADPPGSKTEGSSKSVAVATINNHRGLFIDHYIRGDWSDVELAKKTLDMADTYGYKRIKIEKDRYPHLKGTFKVEARRRGKRYSFEDVRTRGRNKDEDRIMRVSALAEEGLLWIREDMNEYETEAYTWPRGKTNDLLDASAYAVLDDFKMPHERKDSAPPEEWDEMKFEFDTVMKSLTVGQTRYPFEKQCGLVYGAPSRRW